MHLRLLRSKFECICNSFRAKHLPVHVQRYKHGYMPIHKDMSVSPCVSQSTLNSFDVDTRRVLNKLQFILSVPHVVINVTFFFANNVAWATKRLKTKKN